MSGQSNYLGMVTSYKMRETEMGYRGSKSGISVKEQRVDGSWFINTVINLRCTLIETNSVLYLTILPNQIRTKKKFKFIIYK
jgi:hypothetical protein